MTKDQEQYIEHGIVIGLSCAAGIAGVCDDMSPPQLGTMIEKLGDNDAVVNAIMSQLRHDIANGEINDTARWREFMAALVRLGINQ